MYYTSKFSNDYSLVLYLVTYPLDVIRRRMQMKGARWDLFPYTSTPNAIMTMYRTEGIGAFYKGLQTKIGKNRSIKNE